MGVREVVGAPVDDWVWVLFHLAWHFPEHFARGVVRRERWLQTGGGPFRAPEEWVQFGDVVAGATDRFPGLVFSRFPHELDLVTATEYALALFRRAVQETTFRPTDPVREQLRLWHREFASIGELQARRPGPGGDLDARVLRLDNRALRDSWGHQTVFWQLRRCRGYPERVQDASCSSGDSP